MKYSNISTVSAVVLSVCIASGVHAASVGDSQFQADFSIKPFFQNDLDDPLSFTIIDSTTQNNSVCSFNDSSGTLTGVNQCTGLEDISKLPVAASTIFEPNLNLTGTFFNDEESEVFTLGLGDGELTTADFVNPIFSVKDTAVSADFSFYDSKNEAPLRLDVAAVPLPGAVWLLGSGPILAGFVQKKRFAT
ncbi:MAG: hypothetical protein V3V18_02795 [Methylococcales bacterium]